MRVGIVGLGAAGLRTAMLLEKAGVHVTLFEARRRLGGRIHTVVHDEIAYDAGGEWLDADHHRALNLLQELGIEPDPTASWPGKVIYQGEECWDDTLWTDSLEDDLRVEAAAKELCRDLQLPPWRNTHRRELESRTLGDFLRENTSSSRGLWWVWANFRSDEGEDPDKISLLGWLCGYMHYLDRDAGAMSAFRVPGGMSVMIDAMAKTLDARPHLGAVLRRVRQDSEGVCLQFDSHEVEFDRVVLTLPPPALELVVFEPALTGPKRCAIEACEMGSAIKISLQFDSPWWREEGWTGSMLCDSPLQQIWDGTRGTAPILSAYICGAEATKHWTAQDNPVKAAIEELSRLVPKAKSHFVRGWIHDWNEDQYCRGPFSHLAPGYALNFMEHIAPPDGCIHFAGEHTALWTGFIEGALESAERVTEEVLHAAGR